MMKMNMLAVACGMSALLMASTALADEEASEKRERTSEERRAHFEEMMENCKDNKEDQKCVKFKERMEKMKGKYGNGPMSHVDKDKDGKISKKEFMAREERRFAEIDKNNDGVLTKEEMKAHHAVMRKKHQKMKEKRENHGNRGVRDSDREAE